MPLSSLLEILQISESQSAKALAANMAIQSLEKALAGSLAVSTTAAVTPDFNVTLPYAAVNDLSDKTALRFVYMVLNAGATAAFNIIHPAKNHLFFCRNNTGYPATVKTPAGTGVLVAPADLMLLYCDGINIVGLVADSGEPNPTIVPVTSSPFTLTNAHLDGFTILDVNSASAVTINVPGTLTSLKPVLVVQRGAGKYTLTPTSGAVLTALDNKFISMGVGAHATVTPRIAGQFYVAGQLNNV